jgi:hypothetical protein
MDTKSLEATLRAWASQNQATVKDLIITDEVMFELFWQQGTSATRGYITVHPQPSGLLLIQHGTEENMVRHSGGVTRWRCTGPDLADNLSRLKATVDQTQRRAWVHTPSPKIESVKALKFN